MNDNQKMIEICSIFIKAKECLFKDPIDFKLMRELEIKGMEMLRENFPSVYGDVKFIKFITNRPEDYYATLTNETPIFPWLGMSRRELWGKFLGIKDDDSCNI